MSHQIFVGCFFTTLFCQRWLATAGKCSHLHDSVLDIILSTKSEEVNLEEKLALMNLTASYSVESRLHSAENLTFYLFVLIFHCSLELFRAGFLYLGDQCLPQQVPGP